MGCIMGQLMRHKTFKLREPPYYLVYQVVQTVAKYRDGQGNTLGMVKTTRIGQSAANVKYYYLLLDYSSETK